MKYKRPYNKTRVATLDQLGTILSRARTQAGLSQAAMAKSIGKSVGTVQNWEAGQGAPDMGEFIEWFEALGVNPLRYVLDFLYPDTYDGIKSNDSDQTIRDALVKYIAEDAADSEVRKLAFCIFGNTGSSWQAQLDLLCAFDHTPMSMRIGMAEAIAANYETMESMEQCVATDHIMPDMQNLRNAIEMARQAASDRKEGYVNNVRKQQSEE